MATGTVTWFSPARGIGFIRSDDDRDLFVHAMQIDMPGFRTLRAGERVAFATIETDEGPEAIRVTRADAADPRGLAPGFAGDLPDEVAAGQ